MDFTMLAFSIFSTIAIVGSLMVILKRNPVASAFCLVLVFFAFSGLYALLSAHLIAALQILVYTGAIMVLFVFVIMLLNQDEPIQDLKESSIGFKLFAGLSTAALVAFLVRVVVFGRNIPARDTMTEEKIQSLGGNLRVLSESLFTTHTIPFELTSFLLLSAIVSTVALAKRKRPAEGEGA